MQTQKTRYDEPSYFRALVAAGLIDEKTRNDIAWSVWQGVCRDKVIIRKSQEFQKSKHQVSMPSVTAPFVVGVSVLAALDERQTSALKKRIGATRLG